MKTNELRKLIRMQILPISSEYNLTGIYYREADPEALYPHVVYDLTSMNMEDLHRHDYMLGIDIYDTDEKRIEDIADKIEEKLHTRNLPTADNLPTLYEEQRNNLPDEDRRVRHVLLRFAVQNYER